MRGTVKYVDDMCTLHCAFDNGRQLGIIPGEDSFTVLPPKLETLKLYAPLTADLCEYDRYGDLDDESVVLDGRSLLTYQDKIAAAIVKSRMPEEAERGVMHWYDEADSVNRKVHSAVFAVEERNGQLWGVAECRVVGTLTPEELTTLKEYISGQASDGWGEGFEQRPIDVEDGEIYVSFWNNGNFWSVMTEEELMGSQVQGMDMSC